MKKIYKIVFLLVITLSIISCKEIKKEEVPSKNFTIEGEIKGLTGDLFFKHPEKQYTRENPFDTIKVNDGKFSYIDSISELNLLTLFTRDDNLIKTAKGGGYYPVKSANLMLFAFPGANINVEGEITDFFNAYPSGDEYNNSLAAINKIAYPRFNESINYLLKSGYEDDRVKSNNYKKLADSISILGNSERLNHIENNPTSLGALFYLNDMLMRSQVDDEKAIELFNKIPNDFAETEYYTTLEARVKGINATKIGMQVPEIATSSTLDGQEFNISSLKGKYVLIDFWGIWCGPCVEEMPRVKEFQEEYKDKLVVLGVNSGDRKERIKKFVEERDYTWPQLMSIRDNSDDNFVNRFNVKGFPTKFIIDPEGKIVNRYLGSGEEAFELLEELLK